MLLLEGANGEGSYHVVVFTLTDDMLFWLVRQPLPNDAAPKQVLFAALYVCDLRSGGAETVITGSKQGLGLTGSDRKKSVDRWSTSRTL
jgi:hypothetical protein